MPATSTNEEAIHSNQDSSCEHQSFIKGTMAMESEIDDSNAVATQPSAEIGGVIKRRLRAASEESTEMLSSEGIIGCGFEWRSYMVVLSACNSAKGKVGVFYHCCVPSDEVPYKNQCACSHRSPGL